MRRSYLAGIFSFAALCVSLVAPRGLEAQSLASCLKSVSVSPRFLPSPKYNLVDKVGDIMTYYDKATGQQVGKDLYFKNLDKYTFSQSPVYMPRTGSASSVGMDCSLDQKTNVELRFSGGTSRGLIEGTVEQGTPYTIRLMIPTWRAHLFPLYNTDRCEKNAELYCIGDVPYRSSDDYKSNSVDLLVRRTWASANGFALRYILGLNYERQKYTFVTGMRQHAKYEISSENLLWYVPNILPPTQAHYRFENFVGLETVSASTANYFGPTLGLNVAKAVGKRLTLAAEVRNSWRREWGRDTVSFVDTDNITETLTSWVERKEIFRSESFYDGFLGFGDDRSGYSTRTVGDLSADLTLTKRIKLQGGFTLSHGTGYLTQQLTDPWGLGSNKAPRAMELQRIPEKSGMPTGFGVKGWYVGAKLRLW